MAEAVVGSTVDATLHVTYDVNSLLGSQEELSNNDITMTYTWNYGWSGAAQTAHKFFGHSDSGYQNAEVVVQLSGSVDICYPNPDYGPDNLDVPSYLVRTEFIDQTLTVSSTVAVVAVIGLTADEDPACVGCPVMFHVTTDPPGHGDLVQWSGGSYGQSCGNTYTVTFTNNLLQRISAIAGESGWYYDVMVYRLSALVWTGDPIVGQPITFSVGTLPAGFENLVVWDNGTTGPTSVRTWALPGTYTVTASCGCGTESLSVTLTVDQVQVTSVSAEPP